MTLNTQENFYIRLVMKKISKHLKLLRLEYLHKLNIYLKENKNQKIFLNNQHKSNKLRMINSKYPDLVKENLL